MRAAVRARKLRRRARKTGHRQPHVTFAAVKRSSSSSTDWGTTLGEAVSGPGSFVITRGIPATARDEQPATTVPDHEG